MDNSSSHELTSLLTTDSIDFLSDEAIQYSLSHGLCFLNEKYKTKHTPFSLFPVNFPSSPFYQSIQLAPIFNLLVDRCARDIPWLIKIHENVIKYDEFTKKLIDICIEVYGENGEKINNTQTIMLGINRSDYMLNMKEDENGYSTLNLEQPLLQIELNTIASSFGVLSSKVRDLHYYLYTYHFGYKAKDLRRTILNNPTIKSISNGLAQAHNQYLIFHPHSSVSKLINKSNNNNNNNTNNKKKNDNNNDNIKNDDNNNDNNNNNTYDGIAILFVVQGNESNIFDQKIIEYQLWERQKIRVIRATLSQIYDHCHLSEETKRLYYHNPTQEQINLFDTSTSGFIEISVVYFRAGYTPNDYNTNNDWDARLLIERSLAVKCPSIPYQLAGTKKVQQVLSKENELAKFIYDENDRLKLLNVFAKLYSLDKNNKNINNIIDMAMNNSKDYVLKPQREGGGNNFYGDNIKIKLNELDSNQRAAYILMQRINPPLQKSIFLREGKLIKGKSLSELGIYSIFIGDGKREILNTYGGFLLRSKMKGVDEGGVASGYAVLNSPYLVNDTLFSSDEFIHINDDNIEEKIKNRNELLPSPTNFIPPKIESFIQAKDNNNNNIFKKYNIKNKLKKTLKIISLISFGFILGLHVSKKIKRR